MEPASGQVSEDKLRYQNIVFLKPNDVAGTSFLNIWHYDQRRFPDLHGYLPAFKRTTFSY